MDHPMGGNERDVIESAFFWIDELPEEQKSSQRPLFSPKTELLHFW